MYPCETRFLTSCPGLVGGLGDFARGSTNDAAEALRLAGFLRSAEPVATGRPSFAEMMATAAERAGPRDQHKVTDFALNERGHKAAERLRQSNRAYEQLFAYVRSLREEWDTPDLIERVYEVWPAKRLSVSPLASHPKDSRFSSRNC